MAALPENVPEARVLVVDDETNIVELLSVSLKFQGFEVYTASNGPAALDKAREVRPDAVILDVMMPGMDGFGVLRRLRADGIDAPALFLTARDTLQDKIAGLTLGGDDYVTKPFSLEEVVARLRVVLRRTGKGVEEPRSARLTFADIELDEDTHEVWKAGEPVSLSPTEFTLLRYFIINAGTVLSKPKILDHVWRYDFGGDVNVVESYVSYLRRKIDTGEKRLLHTLRGVGYVSAARALARDSLILLNNRGMAGVGGRGVPLRVGLVAATLVLVACGLLASGIAVTSILRHSLTNRVDQTLLDASRSWAQAPRRMPVPPMEGPNPARPPSDFYVRGIDADGRIWMAVNDRAAEPLLPPNNDVGPEPVTVGSIDNSHVQWRAMSVHGPHDELTTVAIDLSDVSSTVRALIWSQAGSVPPFFWCWASPASGWCIAACVRSPKSSAPPPTSPRDSSIVVSRNVIRAPRWADCRWRSTACSRRFSAPSHRRSRRPNMLEDPRSGCVASSPMPATNCAHR